MEAIKHYQNRFNVTAIHPVENITGSLSGKDDQDDGGGDVVVPTGENVCSRSHLLTANCLSVQLSKEYSDQNKQKSKKKKKEYMKIVSYRRRLDERGIEPRTSPRRVGEVHRMLRENHTTRPFARSG